VAAIAFTLLLLFCWRWDADLCLRYRGDPLFFAKDLATHVLMTHNLFPELWNGLWNSPFWSLGLEEQLYALYAVFLFLRTRLALSKALLAPLVVAILWHGGTTVAALRGTTSFGTWAFWPFGFWMIWLLGAVAAEAYTGVIRLPAWCYSRRLAWGCAGLSVVLYPPLFSFLGANSLLSRLGGPDNIAIQIVTLFWPVFRMGDHAFAIASFITLNRWVRSEREVRFPDRMLRPFAKVGIFSYSLYLTHLPVILAMNPLIAQLHLGWGVFPVFIRYLFYLPVCMAVAIGFFRLVESRFWNARCFEHAPVPAEALNGRRKSDPGRLYLGTTLRTTDLAACSVFFPSRRARTTKGCSIGSTHGSA
jgi:peptidoglycan/LPS O-acetylase OafA/YrhL